jgi:formylglycine-generating enzyme required for sulfatase activity
MRWIEPGRFMMGSPNDEPQRFNNEGPQDEIAIQEGFWLFDTACTQSLWRAVTGTSPSRFQGDTRPIERVSWHDVQEFLSVVNAMLPGLDLSLPSEAQWEYACRAGTTAPFSFGDSITPEQVNYDGNYPYADAEKGLYRGETVPVGSLPANPWGLYEMHGNVFEWAQDVWQANYRGGPGDERASSRGSCCARGFLGQPREGLPFRVPPLVRAWPAPQQPWFSLCPSSGS